MTDLFLKSDALISSCGLYRYWLSRVWNESLPQVCWVMLNPSTADASVDDPTIRRCMGFTRSWGCGGIVVVNLFAFRATKPRSLLMAREAVGPDNDRHISEQSEGRLVIAAWGACGSNQQRFREAEVLALLRTLNRPLECLGHTSDGRPRHPLYVRGDAQRVPHPKKESP